MTAHSPESYGAGEQCSPKPLEFAFAIMGVQINNNGPHFILKQPPFCKFDVETSRIRNTVKLGDKERFDKEQIGV